MLTKLSLFVATSLIILLFPALNCQLFSPFLVFIFYRDSLMKALAWSLAAGFVLDLFAYGLHFGFLPVAFALSTLLLYDKKRHFFYDNLSTYPIMTALFSSLSTLILALLSSIPLSLSWAASDLVLMPLLDALFAFILYTVPFVIWGPKRRRGEEYFTT